MKKHLTALLITLALCVGTAWAGDFEDGVAAHEKKDFTTAVRKYKSAAAQGNTSAQINLGFMYRNGQGVVQDYAEAMSWFKLAAAQGYAQAQTDVGYMYSEGQGVIQDYAEAVRWYKLAAAQGMAEAQSNLGMMYGNGAGVVQDYLRAHMWFNLAAAVGHSTAVTGRDLVAKLMTQQQVAEAQKLARECQARNFKNCD